MLLQTYIANPNTFKFNVPSTIGFIFDIEKPPTVQELQFLYSKDIAFLVEKQLRQVLSSGQLNINTAITQPDPLQPNKMVTFLPIKNISGKLNQEKVAQIDNILTRLKRHMVASNIKNCYISDSYRCLDNNILITRLSEQIILDNIIFFTMKLRCDNPILLATFNLIHQDISKCFKLASEDKEVVSEALLIEYLIKSGVQINFTVNSIIRESFLVSGWGKFRVSGSSSVMFTKIK